MENRLIDRRLRDTIAFFRVRSPRKFLPNLDQARALCFTGIRNIAKSTNPIDSIKSIRLLVRRFVFNADSEMADFEYNFVDSSWEREEEWRIEQEILRGERV